MVPNYKNVWKVYSDEPDLGYTTIEFYIIANKLTHICIATMTG